MTEMELRMKIPFNTTQDFALKNMAVGEAVQQIYNNKFFVPSQFNTKPHAVLTGFHLAGWQIALAWVLRIQSKQQKTRPFATPHYRNHEALGELLNAKLELCFRLIDTLDDVGIKVEGITNGVDLWKKCVEEEIGEDLKFHVLEQHRSKKDTLNVMKAEIQALNPQKISNPYPASMPYTHTLFNAIVMVCTVKTRDSPRVKEIKSNFRKMYYSPFYHAYKKWFKQLERTNNTAFTAAWVEDGKVLAAQEKKKDKPAKMLVYAEKCYKTKSAP